MKPIVETAGRGHRTRRRREKEERRKAKSRVVPISDGVALIQTFEGATFAAPDAEENRSMRIKQVKPEDLPDPLCWGQRQGFAHIAGGAGGGARFCSTKRDKR